MQKKIWKDHPLICPECLSEMKIISFIAEVNIIKKILKYLELRDEESSRDPPVMPDIPNESVYAPIDDGWMFGLFKLSFRENTFPKSDEVCSSTPKFLSFVTLSLFLVRFLLFFCPSVLRNVLNFVVTPQTDW
ncbi:hypothetical protein KJ966_29725 [bacterium]|nr:hypothetical protein [bacterium]